VSELDSTVQRLRRRGGGGFRLRWLWWLVLVPVAIILLSSLSGCFARPEAGEYCVVRNGGPFDNKGIRQTLKPGTGTTWTGFGSHTRCYPAAFVQRYYTITSTGHGDRPGVDVVRVQSADGVLIGIEGTFYFNTAFDANDRGDKLIRQFDTQFGTRTFPSVGGGGAYHPWDGDIGWSAFLDAVIRPQIENELRQAILKFRCPEIVSSCALIQNTGGQTIGTGAGKQTNVNLQAIQNDVDRGLKDDINTVLGADFLKHIRFQLVRPTLPDNIQAAINDAQAAFAQIAKAKAQVAQARQQRLAAEQLANIYKSSPQLAQIRMLEILCGAAANAQGANPGTSGGCNGANVFLGVNPVVTTNAGK
jgi:hypothetical protein